MLDLFDITKIIFEKPNEWKNVTSGEKKKYYFAINRRFSIQFPQQANALQHLKINQAAVIDFWQIFMQRQNYRGRTPSWMYTKGIKKAASVKQKKTSVNVKMIDEYAKRMRVDKKAVIDALEFYPKEMTKELKDFEKIISQK
jgi:hypothetical protein